MVLLFVLTAYEVFWHCCQEIKIRALVKTISNHVLLELPSLAQRHRKRNERHRSVPVKEEPLDLSQAQVCHYKLKWPATESNYSSLCKDMLTLPISKSAPKPPTRGYEIHIILIVTIVLQNFQQKSF